VKTGENMLDSKQQEAQLLGARERLARAFGRLNTISGGLSERLRQLGSTGERSQLRIKEIEGLLERERAIAAQSQSLSESTTDEVHVLSAKLEKAEKQIAERDKKIKTLEKNLELRDGELHAFRKAQSDSLEQEEKLRAEIIRFQDENTRIERKLELLIEDKENLQQLLEKIQKEEQSFALTFTQDERLSLLKTVDSLIERVDSIAGN
jgi:DNA repair exonuclease SbcCD ATPase subunit